MPKDLKLITKRVPGTGPPLNLPNQANPPATPPSQANPPNEFFGERTNDIQLSTVNDIDTVEGLVKLKQDINKNLLTGRGTNTFFNLYGTFLQDLIGQKANFGFIQAKIKDEITTGLRVLSFINKNNPNPDEQIDVLRSLRIQQLTVDAIEVELTVITVSQKVLSTTFVITA